MTEIGLGLDRHEFACPLCQQQTEHFWPGATILFAAAKCMHCGGEFLIVENKPQLETPGSNYND